ncbi:MAG: ATP-binding protein [Cyclobacteriaceae bacterium]|nr:MAG: ATP-binding protein [Cyclobacteriaceae bacterium]
MSVATHDFPAIKKVCIIGPECTGKSELSKFLANHYTTCWIPEYARAYLDTLRRPYKESDLLKIAHGQLRLEDEWLREANRVMICDTNLLTIKIWSNYKYGKCDDEILKMIDSRTYQLYLLCYIDIPWVDDPQREHPDKREHFWQLFKQEVAGTGIPFVEIGGTWEQRQQKAIAAIDRIVN